MRFTFLPSTVPGRWAVALGIAAPLLVAIGGALARGLYADVTAGSSVLDDVAARPVLALTMVAGIGAGVAAFVVGLTALLRAKERSLLTFVATVVGAAFVMILLGELVPG